MSEPVTTESEAFGVCERVVSLVGRGVEAVVTATIGTSSLTRFANSRIHQNVTEEVRTVSLAVAVEGRLARAETTRTDPDALAALVERARAAAELRPPDPDFGGFAPPAEVVPVDHWDDATAGATPDQRADIVAAFVDAGRGLEAAGFCSTEAATHVLVSTTGQRAGGRSSTAQVDGVHRAASGAGARGVPPGRVGSAAGPGPGSAPGSPAGGGPAVGVPWADGSAQALSSRLADLDGAAVGRVAAVKARTGLDPVQLAPGTYEVVLEPRAVAAALVFPAFLGFNGKAHLEGTSFVQLSEQQWDESVDIWDDATDPRALGFPFDAEGTPKRRLDLVDAGVSAALAYDRRSARLAGAEPTGHSTGSEAIGAFPGDLFLGAGDRAPHDLVEDVDRGLLVTDLWYNRVLDPKTQVVTGLTRNGLFLIEAGAVVSAVENLRYTQSIVAAFGPGNVVGLANDAQLAGGTEGAAMHVPSVHLATWSFTGNARG